MPVHNIFRSKLQKRFQKARATGLLVIAAFGVAGFAGCSFQTAKAKSRSARTDAADGMVTAAPAWNWENYPPVTRMKLATLPCQLQPKSTIVVSSPLMGILRVYVSAPQTNLPAGFLWAEFEPEIFAAEKKSLTESLKKLEDQEKLQWEIEYPRKKIQLEDQIEEAENQARLMKMLSTNAELAEAVFRVSTNHGNPMKPDAVEKSETNLNLLKQSLDFLESTNFAAVGVDLAGQRTDWERRNLDFQRRQQQARFAMPFPGTLTVSVPLTEGVLNYPVNAGQELGVARDVSAVRVRVAMDNVAWTGLPLDRLKVYVRSGDQSLEAKFSYQKIERVQNREESACYFEFAPEKAKAAARLIGANVSCDLWIDLPEPARVVPKLAVVLHQPDSFQTRNWSSALSSAFPGSRLVVEGQTDLAIVVPKPVKMTSLK
jgi:hypothetical protein